MEIKSSVCPACKEMNNPAFSACWKCHQSLDQAASISTTDDLKESAKKGWGLTKQVGRKAGMLLGMALDKVGDFSKHVCVYNGMSPEKAEKVSKTVKVVAAVGGTAIGCAVAAPAVIAAIGGSAGAVGAAAVTHGLATLGGGSLAAGGAGMAGGVAVTVGASAIAAGAAGVAAQKREENKGKETREASTKFVDDK